MPRGREKDREMRRKHRKNQRRVKNLENRSTRKRHKEVSSSGFLEIGLRFLACTVLHDSSLSCHFNYSTHTLFPCITDIHSAWEASL